jgi:hypothetical protein
MLISVDGPGVVPAGSDADVVEDDRSSPRIGAKHQIIELI